MRKSNNERVLVVVDDARLRGSQGFLDITGADGVDVQIAEDRKVLWVHVEGKLVLRICRIEGSFRLTDLLSGPNGIQLK